MKKCNCICHFNRRSPMQVPEGRTMGCGTCEFSGKVDMFKKINKKHGYSFYPVTYKCKERMK